MIEFIKELFDFFKAKKKLWLFPLTLVILFIGGLLIFSQGTVFSPFIYAIF
ncbi:DUF5989 family protein [Methylophilaceae bacterium]|nr:DUF5989 family protein [Methylophilaceae bacterium]